MFTAITGSGGAQLRFSTASPQQIEADPHAFVRALRYVNLPGDSLFTVRFGGGTWHQFAPAQGDAMHSAFFALSCHPDEAGGVLSDAQQALVNRGQATIASLTELLPASVTALLQATPLAASDVPTVSLCLHVRPESWKHAPAAARAAGAAGCGRRCRGYVGPGLSPRAWACRRSAR
ncbi:hypothetical protein [Xanthomonas campestris]|uniref:hypothetical protein n=1 Tax=Xanthomonas campestris TaxID=339 RepID=UPI003CCFEA2D